MGIVLVTIMIAATGQLRSDVLFRSCIILAFSCLLKNWRFRGLSHHVAQKIADYLINHPSSIISETVSNCTNPEAKQTAKSG